VRDIDRVGLIGGTEGEGLGVRDTLLGYIVTGLGFIL
jgi:hypothetical protein